MHYENSTIAGVIGVSILFAVTAFGINQYKKDNDGFLKLSNAIKIGVGIALIAGILGLIWYFLLSNNIIEAGYMDKAMAIAKEKQMAANPQMTEEQWNQGVEMQKKFMWLAYPFILIFNIILGLVAGLFWTYHEKGQTRISFKSLLLKEFRPTRNATIAGYSFT